MEFAEIGISPKFFKKSGLFGNCSSASSIVSRDLECFGQLTPPKINAKVQDKIQGQRTQETSTTLSSSGSPWKIYCFSRGCHTMKFCLCLPSKSKKKERAPFQGRAAPGCEVPPQGGGPVAVLPLGNAVGHPYHVRPTEHLGRAQGLQRGPVTLRQPGVAARMPFRGPESRGEVRPTQPPKVGGVFLPTRLTLPDNTNAYTKNKMTLNSLSVLAAFFFKKMGVDSLPLGKVWNA